MRACARARNGEGWRAYRQQVFLPNDDERCPSVYDIIVAVRVKGCGVCGAKGKVREKACAACVRVSAVCSAEFVVVCVRVRAAIVRACSSVCGARARAQRKRRAHVPSVITPAYDFPSFLPTIFFSFLDRDPDDR